MDPLHGPEYLPKGAVKNAIILLHGLGSNGQDLLSLAPVMADALPNTAFLAPNAPLQMDYLAGGYQWFEYWDRTMFQIGDGIRNATPLVADYVQEVCERFKLTPDKVILCGFSQGTMMSLQAGLRAIEGLGGIIGFSGLLASPETLMFEKVKKLPPVLLVHGLQDMVVPAMASTQAEMVLRTIGAKVKFVQRPYLQHSIDEVGIREAVKFAQEVFAK